VGTTWEAAGRANEALLARFSLQRRMQGASPRDANARQPAWKAVTLSPPGLHRPEGWFHTIHMEGERAWQKMSPAFFTPFGKTCPVFLPMISAKDVTFLLRQEVTMLNKLSLLSFPLTLQQREKVLTTRMLRFA